MLSNISRRRERNGTASVPEILLGITDTVLLHALATVILLLVWMRPERKREEALPFTLEDHNDEMCAT